MHRDHMLGWPQVIDAVDTALGETRQRLYTRTPVRAALPAELQVKRAELDKIATKGLVLPKAPAKKKRMYQGGVLTPKEVEVLEGITHVTIATSAAEAFAGVWKAASAPSHELVKAFREAYPTLAEATGFIGPDDDEEDDDEEDDEDNLFKSNIHMRFTAEDVREYVVSIVGDREKYPNAKPVILEALLMFQATKLVHLMDGEITPFMGELLNRFGFESISPGLLARLKQRGAWHCNAPQQIGWYIANSKAPGKMEPSVPPHAGKFMRYFDGHTWSPAVKIAGGFKHTNTPRLFDARRQELERIAVKKPRRDISETVWLRKATDQDLFGGTPPNCF